MDQLFCASQIHQARTHHHEAQVNKKPLNILSVEKTGRYKLRLVFDDGSRQEVNFAAFLSQSRHPDIRSYLDEKRFDSYRLEHGELVLGDFDLCFPIMDLYLNQIDKHTNLEATRQSSSTPSWR
jgi:hypothetical protein